MIHLSQSKISSWVTCERQFQLRYVDKSGWPASPHQAELVEAMALGELFHSLAAQKISMRENFRLPDLSSGSTLEGWWQNFEAFVPKVGAEDIVRTEIKLTATINNQVKLTGRIDLLVHGGRSLKIYDWKTGRPRPQSELEHDWQTKIYMALLYRSRGTVSLEDVAPKDISMTYWYAREPERSVTLSFNEAWHEKNWREIVELANQIVTRLDSGLAIWPLTSDLTICGRCSFNTLCGRTPQPDDKAEHLEEIGPDLLEESPSLERDRHPDL